MVSFSDELRRDVDPIWQRIFAHPFLIEMGEGTLPIEKFRFYIKQDYPFLVEFARCLGIATAKAQDLETMRTFASLLKDSLTLEMEMLEGLGNRLGVPSGEMRNAGLTPSNMGYTRHMLYVSYSGSVGETLAAMLPCMWSYQEIGERLVRDEGIKRHPIYSEWGATYVSQEYADLVDLYKDLVDRFATKGGKTERNRMRSHFITSSRYEYMFWDMAYRREAWPV